MFVCMCVCTFVCTFMCKDYFTVKLLIALVSDILCIKNSKIYICEYHELQCIDLKCFLELNLMARNWNLFYMLTRHELRT